MMARNSSNVAAMWFSNHTQSFFSTILPMNALLSSSVLFGAFSSSLWKFLITKAGGDRFFTASYNSENSALKDLTRTEQSVSTR